MLVTAVIPALNEAENIAATLRSVRQNYSQADLEIIVVDGGSSDGTAALVPADCTLIQTGKGRARQMNAGAFQAQGDVLVFVHADTLMPSGWRQAILAALADPRVSGGTFQCTLQPAKGFLMNFFNRFQMPAIWHIMYGDQSQFMRLDTFQSIGGFPDIPLMEDVEMSRALQKCGRLVRVPLRVVTSGRRFIEIGPFRQYWTNFSLMIRYLYLGATSEQLRQSYQSRREKMP